MAHTTATIPAADPEIFRSLCGEEDQLPMTIFCSAESGEVLEGVYFLHAASQRVAVEGESVSFSTWVLNASTRPITDVHVSHRAFANERGDFLRPDLSTGDVWVVDVGVLAPGQTAHAQFTHTLTAHDMEGGGHLISGVFATLGDTDGASYYSECDAAVSTGCRY